MQIFPKKQIEGRLALVAAGCFFFSIPFIIIDKALFMVPVIWGIGLVYFFVFYLPHYLRRREITASPISKEDVEILNKWVSFYCGLSPQDKKLYEADIQIFLDEHHIEGIDDVEITREVELLVAASAVRLIFRRPQWEYRDFGDILIYPGAFSTDGRYSTDINNGKAAAAGMVHSIGSVILSLPHLYRSFEHKDDGFNVGYHEFAHVLDGFRPDGIPDKISMGATGRWCEVMRKEFEKVQRGKSVLRQYAGTNEAEFFAVAVEVFFEKPELLEKKAPEVYEQLSEYFQQNPEGSK